MGNEGNQKVAQGVLLAQLEAAKGTCQCKCCQLLRSVSDEMTKQFLQPEPTSTDIAAIVKAAT